MDHHRRANRHPRNGYILQTATYVIRLLGSDCKQCGTLANGNWSCYQLVSISQLSIVKINDTLLLILILINLRHMLRLTSKLISKSVAFILNEINMGTTYLSLNIVVTKSTVFI